MSAGSFSFSFLNFVDAGTPVSANSDSADRQASPAKLWQGGAAAPPKLPARTSAAMFWPLGYSQPIPSASLHLLSVKYGQSRSSALPLRLVFFRVFRAFRG
jgi:hypothetical protein